jgi:hypothetical protein
MRDFPLLREKPLRISGSHSSTANPTQSEQTHRNADGQQKSENYPRERAHLVSYALK